MNNKFKKQNERKEHSFYKEANKSILGSQKLTPEKVRKLSFKLTKWATFTFLIIVTLWGCVNEFIVKTSNNLGQGIEFYQKGDFVYPNMYATQDVVGYTAAKDAVSERVNKKKLSVKGDEISKETLPFNFTTINPFFQMDKSKESKKNYDALNKDDKKKIDQYKDQLFIPSDKFYSLDSKKLNDGGIFFTYNLNEMTVSLSGMFSYWSDNLNTKITIRDIHGNSQGIKPYLIAPATLSVPNSMREQINNSKEIKALKGDAKYTISTWTDFLYYLADKKHGGVDGQASMDGFKNVVPEQTAINGTEWNDFFNLKEKAKHDNFKRSDVVSVNGTFKTKDENINNFNTFTTPANWIPIYNIKDTTKSKKDTPSKANKAGQAQIALNNDAFLNGELTADTSFFVNTHIKNSNKTLDEEYGKDAMKLFVPGTLPNYSNITEGLKHVYKGAQMVVVPIKKGFPIKPSQNTINLIQNGDKGFRTPGFQNRPLSSNLDQGFDPTAQNYGWILIDENGDVRNVHDKASPKPTVIKEADALYGDQRRLGWGAVDYQGQFDDKNNSVFDEKVKTLMLDKTKLVTEKKTITIGDNSSISYDYDTYFAGITTSKQITQVSYDFKGVLPTYNKNSKDKEIWESSILSDSIAASGQDSWAKTRVSFIGWEDWGKAWNSKYGPLYGGFVFPISQLAMSIGDAFGYKDHPWGTLGSILLIVFLVRAFGTLVSMKGTKNQLKMQEVQTDVAKIKARYERYDLKKDKKMKQKQQAEIMALYKKNEVNPVGSLGTIFVTMPIFISLWIIIASLPAYKIASMGAFSFAVSAWYGIFHLGTMFILYLMVGLTVGLVQGVSSKLPTWLANKRKGIKRVDEATKKAMKKQNRIQNIMVIVFMVMGLTVPALFAFYWIASGLFTIFLELGRHYFRTSKAEKIKQGKIKQEKIKT